MKSHVKCSIALVLVPLVLGTISLAQDKAKPPVEKPEVIYAFANGLLQKGESDMAITEYQRIADHYPGFHQMDGVLHNMSVAYFSKKKYEKSRDICLKIKEKYPDSKILANVLFLLGNSQMALNAHKEAAGAFLELYQRDDRLSADALFLAGHNLVRDKQIQEGEKRLKEYLEKYPEGRRYAQAVSMLASILMGKKDFQAAETLLAGVIEKMPDLPEIDRYKLQYALVLTAAKKLDRAKEVLTALMEKGKPAMKGSAGLNLGLLLYRQGNKAEAAEVFARTSNLSEAAPVVASALYNAGISYHETNQHRKAAEYLSRLIDKYPNYELLARAKLLAGLSAFNIKDTERAVKYLTAGDAKALTSRDFVRLIAAVTAAYATLGENDKGAEYCRKVLKESKEPDVRKSAYLNLAQCLAQSGKLKDSLDTLDKAAKQLKDPDFVAMTQLHKASHLFQAKRYEDAVKAARKVLKAKKGPGQAQASANFRIGLCHQMLGKAQEAARAFLAAYEKAPQDRLAARSLFLGAESLRRARKFDDALKNFAKARKEFKDSEFALKSLLGLGMTSVQTKKFKQGEAYLREYLADKEAVNVPNRHLAEQFLGSALLGQERYEDAADFFAELLKDKDLDAARRLVLVQARASALRASGQAEKAAEQYLILAAGSKTEKFKPFFLAGESFRLAKNYEKALDAYQKAIRNGMPDSLQAQTQMRIGECYEQLKEFDKAVSHYERSLASQDLRAYYGYARSLKSAGQHEKAAETFLKIHILSVEGDDKAEALFETALCFAAAGKDAKARKYFSEIVKDYPDTIHAKRAKKHLEKD